MNRHDCARCRRTLADRDTLVADLQDVTEGARLPCDTREDGTCATHGWTRRDRACPWGAGAGGGGVMRLYVALAVVAGLALAGVVGWVRGWG